MYHCTNVQSLLLCNAMLLSQRKKPWEGSGEGAMLLSIWPPSIHPQPGSSTGQCLVLAHMCRGLQQTLQGAGCPWAGWGTWQGTVIANTAGEEQGCGHGRALGHLTATEGFSDHQLICIGEPPPPSLLAAVISLAGPQKWFLWQEDIQVSPTVVDYGISKSGQASHFKRWTAWDKEGILWGSVLS